MENPFSKENMPRDTSQSLRETPAFPLEFPKIYRAPHNALQRIYRCWQSFFARLVGRPDPHGTVPVTVLTGFLGAGKTTLIVNLMKQLPANYRVAWLKNEFGNTAVDSELAADNNIATVKEMLQGCICHVLIGQLGQALEEMLAQSPDRIIIETSGSAAPAPIVWEIRKNLRLSVDGVVTVIDAVNFPGYKDTSYTAKLQAQYTDLILVNKHEEISEVALDRVLDDVYELNPDAPKIKTDHGRISPDVLFGLDSRLFETVEEVKGEESHTRHDHQHHEVELIEITFNKTFSRSELETLLADFPKENFYRIKGILSIDGQTCVLNWAFGRFEATSIRKKAEQWKIVFMGDDIQSFRGKISLAFAVADSNLLYTPRQHHHEHI